MIQILHHSIQHVHRPLYIQMQANQKANKQKAKHFAKDILNRISQMISEHNTKIRRLNSDIDKHNKIHKVIAIKGDHKMEAQFYQFAEDTAEKLKIMNRKVAETERIKKQRREHYLHKVNLMIACIEEIVEQKSVRVNIDANLVKLVQESGQLADEIVHSMALMQKQSFGCCFGGNKNTEIMVEKSLLQLISFYQFWLLLPRCVPQLQREIQIRYEQLDYNSSIFFDVDKMIVNDWPAPEIVEVEREVQKIIEKVVVKQAKEPNKIMLLPEPSFKEQVERRELQERCERLQKEVNSERLIREAHEMLIGLGRPQNPSRAIQIYKSIPEINQSDAKESMKSQTQLRINPLICNILGCLHEDGKYMPRQLKKAVQFYIKSASVQDPEGMYKIGKFLEKNLVNSAQLFEQHYANRKEEIRDAIEHYEKAAEKGHLDAITDLGHIYENGIRVDAIRDGNSIVSDSEVSGTSDSEFIVEPNLEYAVKYYQMAKKQQFPRALNNLGALYIKSGDKIPQTMKGSNLQRGIKYLKKASEMMHPKAFLNLGKCFEKGLGVKLNKERAKALYIQGAELGDNQCKLELIRFLISNQLSTEGRTDLRIAEYLRQIIVSDPTNSEALYLMGLLYEKGIFVEISPEHAFHYVSRAAKAGHPPANTKLGDYFYSGYFAEKSMDRAQHYYQKGAAKGESTALINLGLMYSKGEILLGSKAQQLQKSHEYLIEAAKAGNPNAFIFLNKQKARERSVIKQAAQLGSSQALKILARTSPSTGIEIKTIEHTKAQYGVILNKLIKETTTRPKPNPKITKRTQLPPLSSKERQMMMYSPRSRVDHSSPVHSVRFNSPQSYRQSLNCHDFYR